MGLLNASQIMHTREIMHEGNGISCQPMHYGMVVGVLPNNCLNGHSGKKNTTLLVTSNDRSGNVQDPPGLFETYKQVTDFRSLLQVNQKTPHPATRREVFKQMQQTSRRIGWPVFSMNWMPILYSLYIVILAKNCNSFVVYLFLFLLNRVGQIKPPVFV